MILVTGASGFVGRHVVVALAAGGRPVRALVRSRARAVLPDGVGVAVADLTDTRTLPPALEGVETVIHCGAITANLKQPYRDAYDAVNRAGTEHLAGAARRAGVRRLVAVSGLGTKPAPPGTYMATRWGLEEAVRGSHIPYVILRLSVLFGDGAEFVSALAGVIRAFPVVPMVGGADLRFQPLWIEDAVRCLVQATEADALLGREISLGGAEQLTNRELLETIGEAMGKRRPLLPLPLLVARMQARLMIAVLPRPPLTPAALELFSFDNVTAPDSVERDFGFKPRGFREHLLAHGVDG